MKTLKRIISGGIAVAAAVALSAHAQNLLVNGDFEDAGGFTANPVTLTSGGINGGWALFDANASQNGIVPPPYQGNYDLLVQCRPGDNWNPEGAYQIVSSPYISPGIALSLSVWYMTDTGVSLTSGGPVDVQLHFLDNALGNLATYETGWIGQGMPINTWEYASVSGVAPVGTEYASVYLMFMDNGQTATEDMYFDYAVLPIIPEPSTLALLGMGSVAVFCFSRRRVL